MKPITINPNNKKYFSDDFLEGFKYGVHRQYAADEAELPHWIPATERLPEPKISVIFSTKEWTGEGCYFETTENHVIWKGYRWGATYWDDEVIAWMPKPEPYKEADQ